MKRPFRCGRFSYDGNHALIMGIVNVTPDSFSDGGKYHSRELAIQHARQLIEAGAHILDIGGESTRPGAAEVSVDEELDRVIPVIEALKDDGVALSVDTYKPEVMSAAIAAGVDLINDVNALEAPGAIEAVAGSLATICLMHKQGTPQTMQQAPVYQDVVAEVDRYLMSRVEVLKLAGVDVERIWLDPGFGFGKSLEHNVELMRHLPVFTAHEMPVLIGLSRKSMLGAITGEPVDQRVFSSIAAALVGISKGAHIVRVHDVAATASAIKVWESLQ
ncbi:dihydropteroate synthase [Leeia oryzae]|uniref:dihydropteroate synthase n=1 Tax=Leeia oryzae TaxID=356662 RepID=UPI0003602AC7|nr:dihydropteroate synthase [Leeia oryzae]